MVRVSPSRLKVLPSAPRQRIVAAIHVEQGSARAGVFERLEAFVETPVDLAEQHLGTPCHETEEGQQQGNQLPEFHLYGHVPGLL